jgi:two-component system, NarL family, response regulator NreC
MRILVVDDNEVVRNGVAGILASKANWTVCGQAKDGAEGIRKALELTPDLILLDISMPGLNGLEVARRLRQEVPRANILIMSQNDPVHLLPSAMEAGAQGCVDKSRLSVNLLPAIENIEKSSQSRRVSSSS